MQFKEAQNRLSEQLKKFLNKIDLRLEKRDTTA